MGDEKSRSAVGIGEIGLGEVVDLVYLYGELMNGSESVHTDMRRG
jgi:hypothetical protein